MISRSVAQIATASIRTSTSAFFGTGTGLLVMLSCPGSPSTHARWVSGIGNSLWLVITPAGAYMVPPKNFVSKVDQSIRRGLLNVGLRPGIAELGRQSACRGHDLIAHQCQMFVTGPHGRSRGADGADDRTGLVTDRSADTNDSRLKFFAINGVAAATDDAQRLDQCRKFRDGIFSEAFHAVRKDSTHLILGEPGQNGFADRRRMRRFHFSDLASVDPDGVARLADGKRNHRVPLQ